MGTTALSHDDRWWAVRADTADGPSGRRRSPSRRRRRRFLRAPTHRPPAVLPARPRPPPRVDPRRQSGKSSARAPSASSPTRATRASGCGSSAAATAATAGCAGSGPCSESPTMSGYPTAASWRSWTGRTRSGPSTRRREACARWPSSTLGTRSRAPTAGPMVADTVHPDVGPAALPGARRAGPPHRLRIGRLVDRGGPLLRRGRGGGSPACPQSAAELVAGTPGGRRRTRSRRPRSVAATDRVDYLLTWNLRHIAGAAARSRIERACRNTGYEPPVICTPNELMEEYDHGDIAELRAIRQEYAARFDYDVEAMFRDIRARQEASGREYVQLPARRPASTAQDRLTP